MAVWTYVAILGVATVGILSITQSRRKKLRSLKNIPGPPSQSLLTGNLFQMFDAFASGFQDYVEQRYGRVIRLHGFLHDALIMIADTKALTQILVKDQDIFEESSYLLELSRVSFGPGLLTTLGDQHRNQRKLLSPIFSSANMRQIYHIFIDISNQVKNLIQDEVASGAKEIDMLDWMSRLALEAIGQGGFGHKFDVVKSGDDEYAQALKRYFPTLSKIQHWAPLLPLFTSVLSDRVLRCIAGCVPWANLHDLMSIVDVMHVHSTAVFESKRAIFDELDDSSNNEEPKDLMSLFMRANNNLPPGDRLPDEELLSETNTMMFAGTDTTSSALARILLLLAENPERQVKLRDEISSAGELSYDALMALPYLDAVCKETLRLYPAVRYVMRESRQETCVSLSRPITGVDGTDIHEVVIPADATIVVNISGANRDPETWGLDSLEWKPERWIEGLPDTVGKAHIPSVYGNSMTFLAGGRSCIGFKFAELEMKTVLSQLIPYFEFAPSKDKVVIWRTGIIMTPAVQGSKTTKPQLPLQVSLINGY